MSGIGFALGVFEEQLVLGGSFDNSVDASMDHITSWNGFRWSTIGQGVDHDVYTLLVYNSRLVVGGAFSSAGGLSTSNIAIWGY